LRVVLLATLTSALVALNGLAATRTETFPDASGTLFTEVGTPRAAGAGGDYSDFGFSDSTHAGGAAGEGGGAFVRKGFPINAFADTNLGGTIGRSKTLVMSGSFNVDGWLGFDGFFFLGYFNAPAETSSPFLGIRFQEPGNGFSGIRARLWIREADGSGVLSGSGDPGFGTVNIELGEIKAFNLTYTGNPDGSGVFSGTIDGEFVAVTNNTPSTTTFNAFGLGAGFFNNDYMTKQVLVYFDGLTYTVGDTGAPTFTSDPIVKPKALQDVAYAGQTLADSVSNPNGYPLTFAKVSGPAWLNVAANGALTGTPTVHDTFTNNWVVSVIGGAATNTATLKILVGGSPKWSVSPVLKPNAAVGVAYAAALQTLAASAADPDGDALTFSKLGGPAWLVVAADGSLSGTPAAGDVGLNTWSVRVADGTYNVTNTLQLTVAPAGTPITVSATEAWDGAQNPHAGEGVTLTGSGTEADPAVYTLPAGLTITASGVLQMPPPGGIAGTDRSIGFLFTSGDLRMDSGGVLNVGRLNRNGRQICILDLGTGSITGAGRILGLLASSDSPRVLTISNVTDVTLAEIDLQVRNANNSGRHLRIMAGGRVNIGRVDNSDQDRGGNPSSNVEIAASVIEVGGIDTRAMRTSGQLNGDVILQALGAPLFDPNQADANTWNNSLTLKGPVQTAGTGPNGGNVTLRGVRAFLNPGFSLAKADGGALTLEAGVVRPSVGATASDLFADATGSGLSASHVVQWSGDIVPTMAIARDGANVVVSWNGAGFVLQTNSAAANPAGWTTVPNATSSPATLPISPSGSTFFRVKK
jgi:hypothetical protein